jgi:hypothetical protein
MQSLVMHGLAQGSMLATRKATLAPRPMSYLTPDAAVTLHAAPRGKAAGRLADDAGGAQHLLLLAARNALILVTAAYLLLTLELPAVLRQVAYISGLYGFITLLMDSPAAAVSSALGMQLTPTFDEPWLSTSVGDFWGRRWNIPTASLLRWEAGCTLITGALLLPA